MIKKSKQGGWKDLKSSKVKEVQKFKSSKVKEVQKFNAFKSSGLDTSAATDTRPAIKIGQLTACQPGLEWPLKRLYRGQAGQCSMRSKAQTILFLKTIKNTTRAQV
jgi:hypothetical protein